MQYVLLIHTVEAKRANRTPDESAAVTRGYMELARELAATGRMGDAAPLEFIATATSVRVRNGKRVVTDGPFAETREQLGGYFVVKTKDIDEAVDIAAKIPDAKHGSIEVRPVPDMGTGAEEPAKPAKPGDKDYLLMIYEDEKTLASLGEAEQKAVFGRYMEFTRSIKASGNYVAGAPLSSAKTAKTVRLEKTRVVTDGPFAETREQLGGYYRVRAPNLDVALDLAAKIPAAETGTIEVRPIMDMTGKM
jgi:hypothetical protein